MIAVPLGASSVLLWCFSMISISNPLSPSTAAAFFERSSKRFMPSDILKVKNTGMTAAASRIEAICSSDRPVVATTAGIL